MSSPAAADERVGPDSLSVLDRAWELVRSLEESRNRVVEELVDSNDRIADLRALIEVPVGSLDEDSALQTILDVAVELTRSDCAVLLHDGAVTSVGDAAAVGTLTRRMAGLPAGLVAEPRSVPIFGGTAVVGACGPVTGAVLGVARLGGPEYSTGDLQLIEAVVAAAEKMVTLTRLHRAGVQRAAIEREHQLACTLAQAVLPTSPPDVPGLRIFTHTSPARQAGGDFIAFENVGGALWFAVGDVAGKGLPAAVVMTRAISAVRVAFHTHADDDPAGALAAVGRELYDFLSDIGLFVTMTIGVHRPGRPAALLCNAGHSPVLSWAGDRCSTVPATMPPLGVVPDSRGRTQAVPLGREDLLLIGSDGLVDQQGPTGAQFGYDTLEQVFAESAALPVDVLGPALLAAVDQHADGTAASDDCTLVLLRGV
ncbi:PP2C family protein-serine/threonine phosphatase [Nakamurella endophytica]|uniref:PPM-type phosphatase domain-containing protein n=1 Tax=Nakamurella endophytica TaxID=1748367 RepID=A0A917SW15_9ACTN|nr:SpoIIE family protein phosphatase [Nakamurella endophytica]GGM00627.1 hypothetical protein GCM10011594_20930 [Nakamurella endophytica]